MHAKAGRGDPRDEARDELTLDDDPALDGDRLGDDDALDPDARTRQALVDAGEGTLDPDGRPIRADEIRILRGVDEEDWTGPTGP